MARIPTPAEPGQAVGSVQTSFTPTPYQNFQTSADMFGAAQGRALSAVAKGLGEFSSDINTYLAAEDKRSALKMEADLKASHAAYLEELKSKKGEDALTYIKGTSDTGAGMLGDVGARAAAPSVVSKYREDMAAIRKKYTMNTMAGSEAADLSVRNSEVLFRAQVAEIRLAQEKVVTDRLNSQRIATAAIDASSAVGSATFPASLKISLQAAESAVRDPDVGMAASAGVVNPVQVDLLVREQQASVLNSVVQTMISKGMLSEASDLLNANKDILAGTKAGIEAQSKVTPFLQKIEAQKAFSVILSAAQAGAIADGRAKPKVSDLMQRVYEVRSTDPIKAAALEAELSDYIRLDSQQTTETMQVEFARFLEAIATGKPMNIADFPTLMLLKPELMGDFDRRQQTFVAQQAANATQRAHESNGGGRVPNKELVGYISKLGDQAFVSLIKAPATKSLFNAEDWNVLTKELIERERKLSEAKAKAPDQFKVATIAKEISAAAAGQAIKYEASIQAIINSQVKALLDAGKPVVKADLQKIVAEYLLKVRTERTVTGVFETYDLVGLHKNKAGVDVYTALIDTTDRNHEYLSILFNKPKADMKKLLDSLPVAQRTLNGVSKALGQTKSYQDIEAAELREETMVMLAISNNMPPAFLKYLMTLTDEGRRDPGNVQIAAGVAEAWSDKSDTFLGSGRAKSQFITDWLRKTASR